MQEWVFYGHFRLLTESKNILNRLIGDFKNPLGVNERMWLCVSVLPIPQPHNPDQEKAHLDGWMTRTLAPVSKNL